MADMESLPCQFPPEPVNWGPGSTLSSLCPGLNLAPAHALFLLVLSASEHGITTPTPTPFPALPDQLFSVPHTYSTVELGSFFKRLLPELFLLCTILLVQT